MVIAADYCNTGQLTVAGKFNGSSRPTGRPPVKYPCILFLFLLMSYEKHLRSTNPINS